MKIISWNVNGLRAVMKKGFEVFLETENPDIICIQEIKADKIDIENILMVLKTQYPYQVVNSAKRKGYSGVAIFSKHKFRDTIIGFGQEQFDKEGRVIIVEMQEFFLANIYFPNGQRDHGRVDYKLEFYNELFGFFEKLRSKKPMIVCGDFNTAHREIDLARPKQNKNTSGFLLEEREWLDKILGMNYVDIFRQLNNEEMAYTWWSYMFHAREKNVGWRIDYFFVDKLLMKKIKSADILKEVLGSDHCPIRLVL